MARRLLVFTENYARGGGNRYCVDLINALSGSYKEIVLASNEGGIFPEDIARLPVNVRVVPVAFLTRSRARHALRNIPKLVRAPWLLALSLSEPLLFRLNVRLLGNYVRKANPDVVLGCNGGYPAARATLAMMVAAGRLKIPAVMSIVSTPTPRRNTVARYDRSLDASVWKSVRLVIVNARAISDLLATERDMPRKLARTIYNGLPDAPFSARRERRPEIGFVARLDKAKGVLVLMDAFRQIASRWPKLRLRLMGQGDASSEIVRRAHEFAIADRVDASGFAEGSIEGVLASLRIYAFPSFHEGLPYSILEAMRAGCTIVSTNVGGIPEILRNGVEGLLVPPRDADALARALETLLADDHRSDRLGRAARLRFEQNYVLKNFYSQTVSVFADAGLLKGKRAHG